MNITKLTILLLTALLSSVAGLPATAISQDNVEFQIAQTSVGYCTVTTQSGDPLNVRETPNGRIIGRVPHGSRVSLGVTDGSEGSNWTRIIYPYDGYVASAYLTNCQNRY